MIIKIRRKAVISGRLPTLITEASTLMFSLRKCLTREGLDREETDRIMEIVSLAALSRDEEEHLAKLAERFGEEAGEE